MRLILSALAVLIALIALNGGSVAIAGQTAAKGKPQDAPDPTGWTGQKCAFYAKAWRDLLSLSERKGISEDFISRNEAFIRSDCTDRSDICPASREEGVLVNKLTMATMNFGTASTFVPFVCKGTTGPLKMQ
jgi:hypothetical protein